MAFDFPAAPTPGQILAGPGGSIQYQWDGTKWVAYPLPALYAPLANPVFTGDPQAPLAPYGDNDSSIANTQFVQRATAPALNNVGRNYLHNGLFNVQQRGTGPWTANGNYTFDRWQVLVNGSAVSVGVNISSDANRADIGDETAQYFMGVTCNGTGGAADYVLVFQRIENVRRLAGKTVTVSFYANSSVASYKVGVSLDQNFGTGGSPSAIVNGNGQAVTLSSTVAQFARYSLTFTMPSIAGKTLGTNGDHCTQLNFWFSSGTTQASRAGSIGVQTGVVNLWGVQLEIGSVATPLDYGGSPQQQLAQCQRFYQTGSVQNMFWASGASGITPTIILPFPVPFRAQPTMTGNFTTQTGGTGSVSAYGGAAYQFIVTTSVAQGSVVNIAGGWTASADL